MRNLGFIILAYAGLVSLSFLDNGRGVTYPLILKDFNIDGNLGALIFSLASLSGLLVNFTFKYWLPLFGLVKGMRASLLLLFFGAIGFYLSHRQLSNALLFSSAFVSGIGFGGIGVTMNIMVSEGAPAHLRRRFLSGLHGMYGLASFCAPLLFNFLVGKKFIWSEYFLIVSIFSIIVIVISYFVKDTHKESTKGSPVERSEPKVTTLIVGLMVGLYVSSEILISSRLTLYLTDSGMDLVSANKILSLFFVALLAGRFSFASLNLKIKSAHLLMISLVSTFIFFSIGISLTPYALALCGFSMSYFFPVSIELINEKFHKTSHQMISNTLAIIGINLMLMHNLFGFLSTAYGTKDAFLFFYVLNGASLIFLLVLERITTQPLE